jgi:hypothetical protein
MEKPEKTWIIRIFPDYCSSETAQESYEKCCKSENLEFYGEGKDIVFTSGEGYTHAIILNQAMPVLNIPKENVIGLAQEPFQFLCVTEEFAEYAKKNIGKYYIGDTFNTLGEPFIEGNAYIFYDRPYEIIPEKPNMMSIMISEKMHSAGHGYRHELIKRILQTDLPIDIWGRGCDFYSESSTDKRLRGKFTKYEPYESYKFHIAIENFKSNHYFSEKIINPLLNGTTPIYLGCKNIDSYFPGHVIKLTGNIDIDMNLLVLLSMDPDNYRKAIDYAKCDSTVNLLKNIKTLFA